MSELTSNRTPRPRRPAARTAFRPAVIWAALVFGLVMPMLAATGVAAPAPVQAAAAATTPSLAQVAAAPARARVAASALAQAAAAPLLRVAKIGFRQNVIVAETPLASGAGYRRLTVDGPLGQTVIEVDGKRARVLSSPCKDKICIKFGWLDSPGDFSACLPNRVLVTVE